MLMVFNYLDFLSFLRIWLMVHYRENLAFFVVHSDLLCLYLFRTAKDCGTLAVPMNGSITGRETTFPNEVTFSCDEGFLLNGSTVRRCQADGSWSGTETSCEGEIPFISKRVIVPYR